MKTKPAKTPSPRGSGNIKKSSMKSGKAPKTSSGTTRADYDDEDAAIERATK
jgi:hypothetical protein